MESSTLTLWTGSFPVKGVSGYFLFFPCFNKSPLLNANNVDPDQTPRSAASDLVCRCPFYGTLGINELIFYYIFLN